MAWNKLCLLVFFMNIYITTWKVKAEKLDLVNCGIDEGDTVEGAVLNNQYPFVGVLFYSLYGGLGETRSVTTVVLIHVEFVLANSADIGPMPKQSFRDKARVLLGEGWERGGRRVRNYVVHPEYGETLNSIAIVHLRKPVANMDIKPICPPPVRIRDNRFWIIKFEDNLDTLKKVVLPAADVPAATCRDFYVERNLNEERRRPSFVKCAVSLNSRLPCVWGAGAVLASRDVWGRWQLLGFGVHGPGCGAPARFLHMLRYYPWIEESLDKFQRITISQINPHKYVLRSGIAIGSLMRFGDCDEYEKQNLIYRDGIQLNSDNANIKTFKYNMTIFDSVQYTCLVVQLLYATASAELSIRHFCPRGPGGTACYAYKGTRFDIAVDVIFMERCLLDIQAFGLHINMSLLDIQLWKWEEGTYYEDFKLTPHEYRGPAHMTLFGFEPVDEQIWVPNYDVWSTLPSDIAIDETTRYSQTANDNETLTKYEYTPSTQPTDAAVTLKKYQTIKTPSTRAPKWIWHIAKFYGKKWNEMVQSYVVAVQVYGPPDGLRSWRLPRFFIIWFTSSSIIVVLCLAWRG